MFHQYVRSDSPQAACPSRKWAIQKITNFSRLSSPLWPFSLPHPLNCASAAHSNLRETLVCFGYGSPLRLRRPVVSHDRPSVRIAEQVCVADKYLKVCRELQRPLSKENGAARTGGNLDVLPDKLAEERSWSRKVKRVDFFLDRWTAHVGVFVCV